MLLMFLFQHNLSAVFGEQGDRCCPTCRTGASLPFKSSIVNRWRVCKQMTGAITMWNWLGFQLLKAHRLHYSFYAALWWQKKKKTWIAHQDYNMFVFGVSHSQGTSATIVRATERGWAGTDPCRERNCNDATPYRYQSLFKFFSLPMKSKQALNKGTTLVFDWRAGWGWDGGEGWEKSVGNHSEDLYTLS